MLFVPFGLFGAVALARLPPLRRCVVLLAGGGLLAFTLQIAQLWLQLRVADLADGALNVMGIAIGITLAALPWHRLQVAGRPAPPVLPVLLLGCWVAYKWFPYVPTLDWYTIKQGLKPLLLEPRLDTVAVLRNLAGWLVFAALWRDCNLRPTWLWMAVPIVVVAEVGIAYNALGLDSIVGAGLALVGWAALARTGTHPGVPVMIVVVAAILVPGLSPLVWKQSVFHWLPFEGFLSGNVLINLLSMLLKLYLYGALVWLVYRTTQALWVAFSVPVAVTGAVEAAQSVLAGHTAEITDPLLCALLWTLLLVTEHTRGSLGAPARIRGHGKPAP